MPPKWYHFGSFLSTLLVLFFFFAVLSRLEDGFQIKIEGFSRGQLGLGGANGLFDTGEHIGIGPPVHPLAVALFFSKTRFPYSFSPLNTSFILSLDSTFLHGYGDLFIV